MNALLSLPAREGPLVRVVVETPAGARAKLKLEPGLGAVTYGRALPLGMHYPFDWGFVPSTRAADGDPLDALLYGPGSAHPGTVVLGRLLGMLRLEQKSADGRVRNDRLLVVPEPAPQGLSPVDVFALPERFREELTAFFVNSTQFQGKDVRILGWAGPAEAARAVDAALSAP